MKKYSNMYENPDGREHTEPEEVRRAREFLLRKLSGSEELRRGPGRGRTGEVGHRGRRGQYSGQYPRGRQRSSGLYGSTGNIGSMGRSASATTELDHYENFIEKLRKLIARKKVSYRSQLSVFLGVNGFLFVLNLMGNGLSFPWFFFPAGAMGIGLVSSFQSLKENRKNLREAEQLGPMNEPAMEEFRKLKRYELRSRAKQVNLVTVSTYLAIINLMTSPSVPWALVPIGIMTSIFLGSRASYKVKLKELRENFELVHKQGFSPELSGYEGEAQTAADAVIARLEKLGDIQQLPPESREVLDTYLEQVKILSAQAREIDLILREIPREELSADRRQLEEKIENAPSEQLRKEYERSLEEIRQHEQAYTELEEQRELIELRILSAINNLKKLRIDVARVNSIAQIGSLTNFQEIQRQSRELSDYIHDLAEGYREAEEAMDTGKGDHHE